MRNRCASNPKQSPFSSLQLRGPSKPRNDGSARFDSWPFLTRADRVPGGVSVQMLQSLTSWTHNSGVSDAATFHTTLQRFTPTLLGVVEVPSLHVLRSVTVTHHPSIIHTSQLSDNAYKSGTNSIGMSRHQSTLF